MSAQLAAFLALVTAAGVLALGRPPRARLRRLWASAPAPQRLSMTTTASAVALFVASAAAYRFVAPMAAFAVTVYGAWGLWAMGAARRARADRLLRRAAFDAVAGVADDIRAGAAPGPALAGALRDLLEYVPHRARPAWSAAADAAASGVDVPAALAGVHVPAVSVLLARLAVVWTLIDAGAPLTAVLDRLDGELRARQRRAELAEAQLAAARATTALLTALPVIGLLLGQALGARPLRMLLTTTPGAACLSLALLLQLLGAVWSHRITAAATR